MRGTLAGALAACWLLANPAAAEPQAAPQGAFVDLDGRVADPAARYRSRLDASDPGHLLTIGEEALFLALGTTWYYLDDRNLADWDYPSWKQRFTLEAWRFDNNHFPINFLGHPLSGGAFYAMPRANGYGMPASAAYAFATSFIWEFFIEFREKISVNDLIVTQGAGMPLGEFASKLWHYFNGLPENPSEAQRILAAVLGFPVWVKRKAYGESQHTPGPYDDLGYSTAIRPRLEGGYQARLHNWGDGQVATHGVRLDGRISSIPGEGRPGAFHLFFYDADIVSLALSGGGGRRARELDFLAEMILLGLYSQALDLEGDGPAGMLGVSLGYRYRFRTFDGYNDRLGIVHLPGPAADFSYRAAPATLHLGWRFNGDFAGIHSAAFGSWSDEHVGPGDRAKSILRKHGYHYLWGASSRLSGRLELPPFDAGVELTVGRYTSIEKLDRAQEEITLDPSGSERLLEIDTSLGFTVPDTPLRLGVGWSANQRVSRLEEHSADRTLHTWSTSLGLKL